MLELLSLFFGLVTGTRPVHVAPPPLTAAVEVELDGRLAAHLRAPDWKANVDFGSELLPHALVLKALAADGEVLGLERAWVNLPSDPARVDVDLERVGSDAPLTARVTWRDALGGRPQSIAAAFDGVPLPVDAGGRVELPPHRLDRVHVLTVEVQLSSEQRLRRDVAYGGGLGAEVSTELTAVPFRTLASDASPTPGRGWLLVDGTPATVAAVESGPAQLFVVRTPETADVARVMLARKVLRVRHGEAGVADDTELRFVSPFAHHYAAGDERSELFDIVSPPRLAHRSAEELLVTKVVARGDARRDDALAPRLADAVAVAALEAARGGRRRAVLLVLSAHDEDASRYDPSIVRRYLAALRVPLFVWSLQRPKAGTLAAAWGDAEDFSLGDKLGPGASAIRAELDAQRVALVEGSHLPQSIALSPSTAGVELVDDKPFRSGSSRSPRGSAPPRP